jgi:dihydropteroate synthase
VLPVVQGLVAEGVVVSVDTMRASVAAATLEAGAAVVNDVSGGLADEAMARVVAEARSPYVVMHWRGHSADMASRAVYADVVTEVLDELQARLDDLERAGVDLDQVVVDPGLGFAKEAEHNWSLLAHLADLGGLGRPVLVGASRKGFLGRLLTDPDGTPRPAAAREDATTAVSVLAAAAGAWAVRVHEARATRDAVEVVAAARGAHGGWAAP